MTDHDAPARCAAMLHARDDFLADIAALLEGEPAVQIHQHVMRKGVLQREIRAGGHDAVLDAQAHRRAIRIRRP